MLSIIGDFVSALDILFFFFKQKTAYEMRISDWSSDVCSSDLQVMAVPTIFLNGENFGQGRMELEQILAQLDTGAETKAAEKIAAKAAFDVLVVGGGPAGAAAAIYAARKGIRTGLAAERFGGQVLDTMEIENFMSGQTTWGPKLGAHIEQQGE